MITKEQAKQRTDRDALVKACIFAVDNFLMDNPSITVLPRASQTRFVLEAALGYLLSEGGGLISTQPEDWPEWLSIQIPDHLKPDASGEVARHLGAAR